MLLVAGMGQTEYEATNSRLNIDPKSGVGDWPAGLLSHAAGPTDDGRWAVMEVWESRDAQARFLHERLGRALQEAGITGVPEMTWVNLVSYHVPPGAAAG